MSDPSTESLFNQALAHHQAGHLQQADTLYRQILSRHSDHEATLVMLGVLAHQASRNDIAIQLLTRATQINPTNPDAFNNLGVVLAATGDPDKAISAYETAIRLRPNDARAQSNIGTAYRDAGRLGDAIASYSRAVAIAPADAAAHDNLGLAFQQIGRLPDAVASFRRAAELAPDSADVAAHLAIALRESGQLDESIEAARRAIAIDPSSAPALTALASALKDTGQLHEALDCYRRAADLPGGAEAQHAYLFAIHLSPAFDPESIRKSHARWGSRFRIPPRAYANDKSRDRPLRIGYVSPDFRHHVVGYNILPLLERHDRGRFHIYCYSNTPRPDDLTARFRSLATAWRDIAPVSDERAAEMMLSDGIDILVDLSLHTTANRLGVFALKPAAIQVTFAGYPSTTGLPAIDYRLTDPHLDPPVTSPVESPVTAPVASPDAHDTFYTERSIRLPHSFWCYQLFGPDVPIGTLPALRSGFITFGYLGAFSKINEPTLDLWSRVLASVPNSRFLLMSRPGSPRTRTLAYFSARGTDPARIEFVDYQPRAAYLATYNRIDIVLDSHPYNGHTTSLDALWMGVPVVSLFGQTAVSRAGLSQLTNVGLQELATDSREGFIAIATSLASDIDALAKRRASLRSRMQHSPLADAPGFARGIEAAYRRMWSDWCDHGHAPGT